MTFKFHDLGMSPQKICSLKDRWVGTRGARVFQQKDGAGGGRAGVTVLPFGALMAKEQAVSRCLMMSQRGRGFFDAGRPVDPVSVCSSKRVLS